METCICKCFSWSLSILSTIPLGNHDSGHRFLFIIACHRFVAPQYNIDDVSRSSRWRPPMWQYKGNFSKDQHVDKVKCIMMMKTKWIMMCCWWQSAWRHITKVHGRLPWRGARLCCSGHQTEGGYHQPQKYIYHQLHQLLNQMNQLLNQLHQRPCYRDFQVSVMVGKCGVSVGKCDKECATVVLEVRRS